MSVTPIDQGTSLRTLERRSTTPYKQRCETMALLHEAEAAFWRKPCVATQEAVDNARHHARTALGTYRKAREAADQARQVVAAA